MTSTDRGVINYSLNTTQVSESIKSKEENAHNSGRTVCTLTMFLPSSRAQSLAAYRVSTETELPLPFTLDQMVECIWFPAWGSAWLHFPASPVTG